MISYMIAKVKIHRLERNFKVFINFLTTDK
jgi:hypothetical protein